MTFLLNCWYMAAWEEAIPHGGMLPRTIIGRPMLLHRDANTGVVHAVDDWCPHRFAPLSRGALVEPGVVRCAYHGLEFDLLSGACLRNPHGRNLIPKQMRLRTYAVEVQHGIVWLWPGDGEPDAATIPDYSVLDGSHEAITRRDHLVMDVPYDLIVDNLLDCSHVNWLHDGILGNEAMNAAPTTVEQDGLTLTVKRFMADVPPPAVHDRLFRGDGRNIDHWLNFRWNVPSSLLLDNGITTPGGSRDEGTGYFGIHILTPETENSTHYHTCASRWNITPESERGEVQKDLADMRLYAFQQQDEPMIRAQHAMMQSLPPGVRPTLIETDIGVVRWRRIIAELLEQEKSQASAGETG